LHLARFLTMSLVALAGTSAPSRVAAPVNGYGGGLVVFEESREKESYVTRFRIAGPVSVREMALLLHPYMSRRCGARVPSLDSYDRQTKKEMGQELVTGATIRFRCRLAPPLPHADPHSFVKDMCGEFRASPLLQEACAPFLAE
jgi:hypothetical protein